MGKLTEKVAKGVFWVLLEKFGIQMAHFVVTLVLARLLTPSDYGTVALMGVFITISDIFLDGGMSGALVRKKNAAPVDYSTVFYINIALAVLFYWGLFFIAPYVASFYEVDELCPMLRVLALKVVFAGISDVQGAVLRKKMLFKLSLKITWPKVFVSSVVGVSLAFAGFGPWALVLSSVCGGVVAAVAKLIVVAWRPTLEFSVRSARELYGFGWKLAAAKLLRSIGSNFSSLCVGSFYGRDDLAFLRKGGHIPKVLEGLCQSSLRRVSLPALSRLQDDIPRMRNAMRRLIRMFTFLGFPVLVACTVLSKELIIVLFGEKWLPAVPFMMITSLAVAFHPFDVVNIQAINALGRSDIYLKLMVIRRLLGVLLIIATVRLGMWQFALAMAIYYGPVGIFINAWPNRKLLRYTIGMQLRDVLPSLMLSAAMACVLMAVVQIPCSPFLSLPVALIVGGISYFALAVLFRYGPMVEVFKVLASIFAKRIPRLSWACEVMYRRMVK